MKMKIWSLVLLALFAASGAQAAKVMSVQIREGQLRNRASFLGAVTGTLAYGDRVTVQRTQAGWSEVTTAGGQTGWVHESALTPKRIVMSSGADDARIAASGQEIALAGKGFSQEVEAEYKKQNAQLSYAWVDRMLGYGVPHAQLVEFLRQGGLAP